MKLKQRIKIRNPLGLHTRPATIIVKLLQNCKSEVFFTYKSLTVNAKSILSLLMLAAKKNSNITMTIEGADAEITLLKLLEAFESKFGE